MSFDGGFVGSLVISKNGHDKGEIYVLTKVVDDTFVLVANGENRPLKKPKRKNIRHLFVTKTHTAATSDLEIKRAIAEFRKKMKTENKFHLEENRLEGE